MRKDVDALVRAGLPIADSVARQLKNKLGGLFAVDELIAIARPAVLVAARSYDPARAPFAPYVTMKVKWAILDEARKSGRRHAAARAAACAALERLAEAEADAPRDDGPPRGEADYQAELAQLLAERAAALAMGLVSLPDVERHAGDPETPEESLSREQLRRHIRSAIAALPDRQRALVERHYFGDEQFDTIAAELGVSKSWASRLHAQAMEALAAALRDSL